MNYKTAAEIFKAYWLIESQSALAYLEMFEAYRKTETRFQPKSEENKEAVDPRKKFFASQNVIYAPIDAWSTEAKNFSGFDGADVAVIVLDGPLMKNDYCGWYGTASLLSFFRLAEKTDSVKTIVLQIDSPGGTVDGTYAFASAVKASQKKTISIVSGMMCSAAYWIGSSSDEVITTASTDVIGSIGTMIQWYDRTKYLESNGIVLREYYATKSSDKNRAFREANAGDGKLLVKTMLDPMNNEFLSAVQANREGKIDTRVEDVLTGKTYLAKEAKQVGLIDHVMPIDEALQYAQNTAQQIKKQQTQILNSNKMKWSKVLAFFGLASIASAADVKLEDKDLDNVEAVINERDQLKTENEDLNRKLTAVQTYEKKASEDLAKANASIAEKDAEIKTLNDKVAKLEKEDAGEITSVVTEKDKSAPLEQDASAMDFQKELFSKV